MLNGFFLASPVKPRMAVSIHLLDFYFALLERSGDAITAMSAALRTFYSRRGFSIIDDSVKLPMFLPYLYTKYLTAGECTRGAFSARAGECHSVV